MNQIFVQVGIHVGDPLHVVAKMKENSDFRDTVAQLKAPEVLDSCPIKERVGGSRPELAAAVAECMVQMAQWI